MAEIPIERKPRRSQGPLLLLLVVLLLLAAGWYWWTNYGNDDRTNPTTTSAGQPLTVASTHALNPGFRRA